MRARGATVWVAVIWSAGVMAAAVVPGQQGPRTIWDGVFSDAQAARGKQVYVTACAKCHADDLLGKDNAPALVGEPFLGRFDRSTVDDVVLVVRQTMPQEAPDSLGPQAYVDIVTYLLKANGSPAGATDLSTDRAALKQVLVTAARESR
jgi:mono/diheme cytochrome c family protein